MKLEFLIIHCTATPPSVTTTGDMIRRWHTAPKPQGRGWKQVGYSMLVAKDGSVDVLVPFDSDQEVESWELTNGAYGMNSKSRHIVYDGGAEKVNGKLVSRDTRTAEQTKTLETLVRYFLLVHPTIKVTGHREVGATACPGFDVPAWLRSIGIPESNIYEK